MSYADILSPGERKKYRWYATVSAWFGCVTEQLIDSNSLVILYLVSLGGNASFSMFSSTLTGITSVLLMIPTAGASSKVGLRFCYSFSCIGQCAAFLIMATAPLISAEYAKLIVIICCLIYALLRIPYSISWYPILDMFLRPQDRGSFFGKMRFSYTLINAAILFFAGKIMGQDPPLWILQTIIAIAGICTLGRKFCMDRLPDNPDTRNNKINFKNALTISIKNAPLMGFSFYMCFLHIATVPVIPLAIIYMNRALDFGASSIMTISAVLLIGKLIGNLIVSKIINFLGHKLFQISLHTLYVVSIFIVCTISPGDKYGVWVMGTVSFLIGCAQAFSMCLNSVELMALARPGNKVMANAVISTFNNIGTMVGTVGTTLTLAAGILRPSWTLFNWELTSYQFIFIVFLILGIFGYLFLLLSPSVVPKHDDYYEP